MSGKDGANLPGFQQTQLDFAAHIRHPERNPRPRDVEARRMRIYVELFYNNIKSFLESGFPIFRQLFSDEQWRRLVRDFVHRHESATPYFMEISQEFLTYIEQVMAEGGNLPPFALELTHYEWVELALEISPLEHRLDGVDPNGDLIRGVPVWSPLAWSLGYTFPVHQIGPGYRPTEPNAEPCHLIVYRDRQDEVHFKEANAVTARLAALMQADANQTGFELLSQIAREMAHPKPEVVISSGQDLLQELWQADIIVGSKSQ